MKSITTYLLVNLSVADLLIAWCCIPLQVKYVAYVLLAVYSIKKILEYFSSFPIKYPNPFIDGGEGGGLFLHFLNLSKYQFRSKQIWFQEGLKSFIRAKVLKIHMPVIDREQFSLFFKNITGKSFPEK
jgi:hypothetical protein